MEQKRTPQPTNSESSGKSETVTVHIDCRTESQALRADRKKNFYLPALMMRDLRTVMIFGNSTSVLPLAVLFSFLGIGCGDFFVSGSSLNTLNVAPTSIFLTIGDSKQFIASGTTVDGDSKDVTTTAKWSSSSAAIASVGAGLVKATASGKATITASQDGVSNTAGIIVNTSTLSSIEVSGSTNTINGGQTLQLTATAIFQDGRTEEITNQASWTSDSSTVATVSSTGLVKGVAGGTAKITASGRTTSTTVSSLQYTITVE